MSKHTTFRYKEENEKIMNEFKSFVEEKYGKLHTVFGEEIIKALEFYLEYQKGEFEILYRRKDQNIQTDLKKICVRAKNATTKISNKNIKYIYTNFNGYEYTDDDFVKKCIKELGVSERTARNYIDQMIKMGLIEVRTEKNRWIKNQKGKMKLKKLRIFRIRKEVI